MTAMSSDRTNRASRVGIAWRSPRGHAALTTQTGSNFANPYVARPSPIEMHVIGERRRDKAKEKPPHRARLLFDPLNAGSVFESRNREIQSEDILRRVYGDLAALQGSILEEDYQLGKALETGYKYEIGGIELEFPISRKPRAGLPTGSKSLVPYPPWDVPHMDMGGLSREEIKRDRIATSAHLRTKRTSKYGI